ncbi:uncharacterized protein LOC110654820 isoform X2 [Hevea brasiliensis]|uniref:uncharacterized protein LOC110654820 isoform X2 n=1 Tax=Hevea brasiliensis TaxID=3981 RepID=UPI0025EE9909|nr:uncharacterized protein LOC110654820 isoform X2 [Hevea brasiliensis]
MPLLRLSIRFLHRASFRPSKRKNSAVLGFGDGRNMLPEDGVGDANSAVHRKIEAAAKARELAVEKALAARRAAELATSASDSMTAGDDNGIPATGIPATGIDDVELALQLHRAINSSPRILRNLCSVNSCCLAVRKSLDSSGKSVSDPSVCVRVSGYGSSINMDYLESNGIDDAWIRQNAKNSNVEVRLKEGEGSCSDRVMNSESQSCGKGNGPVVPADERYNGKPAGYLVKYNRRAPADERYHGEADRYLFKYTRRKNAEEKRHGKPDRYLFKYTRRKPADEKHHGEPDRCLTKCSRRTPPHVKHHGGLDRYLFKYTRRTLADERFHGNFDRYLIKYTRRKLNQRSIPDGRSNCFCEGSLHETQALAVGLILSCSKESIRISSASLQAHPFVMHASACSSDMSGDKS